MFSLSKALAQRKANQPFDVLPALHSVLFYFTPKVTTGYSIILIRDPEEEPVS